jgi:hypothetical protein
LFHVYGKNGRFFSCRFIRVNISGVSTGDLHGGANQAVLEKKEIHQNGGMLINIWVPKIKTIL